MYVIVASWKKGGSRIIMCMTHLGRGGGIVTYTSGGNVFPEKAGMLDSNC